MKLIDRSPALFIAIAFAVVYGTILLEIWMWGAASVVAVGATLAVIAIIAVAIARAMEHLLADEDGETPAPAPEPVAAAGPARRPARVGAPVASH